MIPSTLYADLPAPGKLPLSHAGMIPWTAACVAAVAEAARIAEGGGGGGEKSSVLRVLGVARENARARCTASSERTAPGRGPGGAGEMW
jgi:TatD DNase family protein